MHTPQSAIIPDQHRAAIVIEANLLADTSALAPAIDKSLRALDDLQAQFPQQMLGLSIGFGAPLWERLMQDGAGSELKPFTALGGGLAPATQCDMVFHIQCLRPDVSFSLALAVMTAFAGMLAIDDETHGFRWVEDRGLDGFVDGTENPKDDAIAPVAVIADGVDAGGSYLLIQKYRHDLARWNILSTSEQECCVGRSKADDVEFSADARTPDSHLSRTNLKEHGKTLEIVRRSLPYGTVTGENGLLFIAYCARLHNLDAQLKSMFGDDGKVDLLLKNLSTATRGAYYYVPSVERLRSL